MRSVAIQILVVAALESGLTYLTGLANYRSGFNILWILGVPIVTAVVANGDAGSRTLMAIALVVLGWMACSGTGVLIGY